MTAAALKAAATGQASPEQARNPYEHLKRQLEISKGEFAKLVGTPANAEKFIRVVLNAVLANMELLDCTRSSLISSCMRAAQDGLMPDGREAVLNIYNTKVKPRGQPEYWEKRAQYLPMVGGLIKKLYASKEITYVDAVVVHEGDVFKYQRGDTPSIYHEPKGGTDDQIIAVYAIVKLANGEIKREVMWRADIERVRAASKSADGGPWKTWYGEMAIKSVLKRIYKQLPHVDAFETVVEHDNEAMGYTAGESVADIAAKAMQEPQQAIEHQPGEVLEQPLPQAGEKVAQQADEKVSDGNAAIPIHFGASESAEHDLATEIEVKMRAAKTKDALNLQADRARTIKDEAIRLRLEEIYAHEMQTRFSAKE